MANLRVLYSNAIDSATVAASATAGALAASFMKNDLKGQAHRSTGTSVSYTATWAANQVIGGVWIPLINLTASATIRIRLFSNTALTALISDSGTFTACPAGSNRPYGFTGAIDVTSFPFGGGAKTGAWFSSQPANVRGIQIDVSDAGNPAGYIDCARIVAGPYWEPSVQADYGVKASPVDVTDVSKRNQSGDTLPTTGSVHDSLTFDIKLMPETDRANLALVLRIAGVRGKVFVSMTPGLSLNAQEADHMIWGHRQNSPWSWDFFNGFSNSWAVDGW